MHNYESPSCTLWNLSFFWEFVFLNHSNRSNRDRRSDEVSEESERIVSTLDRHSKKKMAWGNRQDQSGGNQQALHFCFNMTNTKKKIKKRPAEQRDPMESLLRRITKLKTSLQLSGHGVEKCCLDKQLLGDEAPALWHLVGHPPQATHLDRTI